jgi:hypothetical protein
MLSQSLGSPYESLLTSGAANLSVERPEPIPSSSSTHRMAVESAISKFVSTLEAISSERQGKTAVFILSLHEAVSLLGLENTDAFIRRLYMLKIATICLDMTYTRLYSDRALSLLRGYCDISITVEDRQGSSIEGKQYVGIEEESTRVISVVAEAAVVRRSRATGRITEDSTFLALCSDSKQHLTIMPLKRVSAESKMTSEHSGSVQSSKPTGHTMGSAATDLPAAVATKRVPIIVFDKSDQELDTAEDDDDGTLDDDLDL